MIDKFIASAAAALADVPDGATVMLGGFGSAGLPAELIDGLIAQGAEDLVIVNGWYFHTLPGVMSWDINGAEFTVWGNYCNVVGGATPVNIYYSTDSGRTVKIAYSFGQNPFFGDDGSAGGDRE